ncbi:MAG: TonB family protein [Robiginitomaculum sp.]|nr:TonB family protein [Robiginitomaculum sp.]
MPNSPASAKTPPEILSAYKAYNSALQKNDLKGALKHAKTAWKEAEKSLGDAKLTGDLAYNYGYLAGRLGEVNAAVNPLIRSADLAHLAKQDAGLIRLEREVEVSTILLAINKRIKAWKRLNRARKFAVENNIDDSVFAGELMVLQSRVMASKANIVAENSNFPTSQEKVQSKSAQFSADALEVFSKHPETSRKSYIANAHKLIGYSHERNKEWRQALLAYQKTMEIQKTFRDFNDRSYMTTIGRWINVRTHFMHDISWEEAKIQGLCECWPYHQESNIKAIPIERIAPKMPREAQTSGFSIIKFDLDDAGNVINSEILQSWPKKIYDKPSIRALKKWKYETKQDGKDGAQRTGIVVPITYVLTGYLTGDPV